ncbi:hypothetical protein KR200_010795, partial [Drosophila serrata]
ILKVFLICPLEFRECFYLFARSGQINNLDELTVSVITYPPSSTEKTRTNSFVIQVIMRSLGLSPTIQELVSYLKQKNGKMSFADFLDIMHQHSKVESLPDEVIAAFKAADPQNKGTISARQLRNLLQNWGEGLSMREVDNIFREANVNNNSTVRYADFVKIACAPVPDYY